MTENNISMKTQGWLFISASLLIFIPMGILGAAIGWPASIHDPAEKMIPILKEHHTAVVAGYLIYLLYHIFCFIALMHFASIIGKKSSSFVSSIIKSALTIYILCAGIGIFRWLFPIQYIVNNYNETNASVLSPIYESINAYGGAIGEVLGLGIFTFIALIFISKELFKHSVPKPLIWMAYIVSLLQLVDLAALFGWDAGILLTISVSFKQFWFLFMGIWMLRSNQQAITT